MHKAGKARGLENLKKHNPRGFWHNIFNYIQIAKTLTKYQLLQYKKKLKENKIN